MSRCPARVRNAEKVEQVAQDDDVPFAPLGPRPLDEMLEEPDEDVIITKVLVAFEGTAGGVEPLRHVHVSKDDEAPSSLERMRGPVTRGPQARRGSTQR